MNRRLKSALVRQVGTEEARDSKDGTSTGLGLLVPQALIQCYF